MAGDQTSMMPPISAEQGWGIGVAMSDYPSGGDGPVGLGYGSTQSTTGRGSGGGGYDPSSSFHHFGLPDGPPPQVRSPEFTSAGTAASNPAAAASYSEGVVVAGQAPPRIRLPGVDGRESLDFWGDKESRGEEDTWEADAMMHMNLTGEMRSP